MIEEQPLLGIKLLGFFEDRRVNRLPRRPMQLLGRMGDVAAFVSQHGVNVVYITLPISPRPGLSKLLRALRDTVGVGLLRSRSSRSQQYSSACRCSARHTDVCRVCIALLRRAAAGETCQRISSCQDWP